MNNNEEKITINEVVSLLCNYTEKIINSGSITSVEGKQKIYAIVSFLEFIKAGADITTETIDSNTVSFIINMK